MSRAHRRPIVLHAAATAAALLIAASAASAQEQVLYREIFPNATGNDKRADEIGTGWLLHTGPQAQSATEFQGNLINGGNGVGTRPEVGGVGALPPVNSNPANSEINRGYVNNFYGNGFEPFWNGPQLYWTTEYAIDRSAFDVSRISWTQASNTGSGAGDPRAPDTTRATIRIGTQFFVSTQQFTAPREIYAMEYFLPDDQSLEFGSATWFKLNYEFGVNLAVDTSAPVALPAGDINAFGLFWDKREDRGGFDGFTIRGSAVAAFAEWANPGSGNWSSPANWSNGTVPNSPTIGARFVSGISAPATVTVDGDFTVSTLVLDNSANRYIVAPSAASSSLTVVGAISVLSGAHTLSVDAKAASLDIATGGQLDLAAGRLAIDFASTSSYADLVDDVKAGRLVSNVGATARIVGVVDAADLSLTTFGDLTVDGTTTLARGTLRGDANLDLTVNFADLVSLAQGYNRAGEWVNGDFNYDGLVNFADLVSLAQNYNQSLASGALLIGDASRFNEDWAFAQSVVPEPTTLAALGILSAAATRRRRQ